MPQVIASRVLSPPLLAARGAVFFETVRSGFNACFG
jgi:hypothetical protein